MEQRAQDAINQAWNHFLSSGRIGDYLQYARQKERPSGDSTVVALGRNEVSHAAAHTRVGHP